MNITRSASCSIAPDSRRSDSTGRLSVRCSTPRLSWESAITGQSSSRASVLRPREIWPICSTRLSVWPSPRLRAHVEHGKVGGVVDEERRLREPVGRLHYLPPPRRRNPALAQVVAL